MTGRPVVPIAMMAFVLVAIVMLVSWAGSRPEAAAGPASVTVDVTHGPSSTGFFAGPLTLPPTRNTALGALEAAALEGGFTYTVSGAYWEAFVVAVGPFENEGLCGWVFDVNGQRSPQGAASTGVRDGDDISWYWDCTS